MAVAARKIEMPWADAGRPRLRAVEATQVRSARRRRNVSASVLVQVSVAAITLLTLAGVVRVAVAVSAQEAAIDAHRLERTIQEELLASRELEAGCSALQAPSRIGALAVRTLNMNATAAPRYICVEPPADRAVSDGEGSRAVRSEKGLGRVPAFVRELVAGEAQALLVGDLGLASSR